MSPEQEPKNKRKTYTSTAVKERYNKKTYSQYSAKFRKIEDADCIAYLEGEKEKGVSPSDTFKKLIRERK